MNALMKSVVICAIILGICSGTTRGDVVAKNADFDASVTHINDYYGINTSSQAVGAYVNGDLEKFDVRAISKWDLSAITQPVSSATITYTIAWSNLRGDLDGNIMISTFTTTSTPPTGAVNVSDDGWNGVSPSTASKEAFASSTGSPDDSYPTYVTVDVTQWLNAAINGNQDYFCVRLSADYLLSKTMTPGDHISYIYPANASYAPFAPYLTMTAAVPEPATLMLLGMGTLAVMSRRRPTR